MFNLSNLLFFCLHFLLIPWNLSYYLHFFYLLLDILPCYLQLNLECVILRLKRGPWSPELLEGEPDLNRGPQTPFHTMWSFSSWPGEKHFISIYKKPLLCELFLNILHQSWLKTLKQLQSKLFPSSQRIQNLGVGGMRRKKRLSSNLSCSPHFRCHFSPWWRVKNVFWKFSFLMACRPKNHIWALAG